jgi:hypothetical protein
MRVLTLEVNMPRNRGGIGPGAAAMGGMGKKPMRPPTAMSRPPMPAGGGGGPSPLAGSPPPVGGGMGMKKGGSAEKHAKGGTVSKHAKGGVVGKGGDSKARHTGSGSFK